MLHECLQTSFDCYGCLQALQKLWEPARFTYQVNNPPSHSRGAAQLAFAHSSKSKLVSEGVEEEEAGSSSSDDEGVSEQPLQGSQVVTRGAEARGAPPSAHTDARYVPFFGCLGW